MIPITIHTKVRRLGYVKLLVLQYLKSDFYSINSFPNYFETVAGDKKIFTQLNDYFNYAYGDKKGIVEVGWNGNSVISAPQSAQLQFPCTIWRPAPLFESDIVIKIKLY